MNTFYSDKLKSLSVFLLSQYFSIGGLAFLILTPWKKTKENNFSKISQNAPCQDL